MKQFNLDEYLKNPSRKVVTRDGRNVTIHCTNFNSCQPIIAQIEGHNSSHSFTKDGKYCIDDRNLPYDLFFATEKHEGWQSIYKSADGNMIGSIVWPTKEEAERNVNTSPTSQIKLVATIKIEWEE